jgi:uncharacterized lipoprotein YmbA
MNDLIKIKILPIILLVTIALMTGCANNPVTHFHVLESIQSTADQLNSQSVASKRVGIREIQFPSYLDRPQIVTRIGANELVLSYSHQWAEPLSKSVARVLTEQLDTELANIHVVSYPWPRTQIADIEVEIRINQFEMVDKQNCILDVSWLIWSRAGNTAITRHSLIVVAVNSIDYSQLVTAHSEALSQLSQAIANSLSRHFRGHFQDNEN